MLQLVRINGFAVGTHNFALCIYSVGVFSATASHIYFKSKHFYSIVKIAFSQAFILKRNVIVSALARSFRVIHFLGAACFVLVDISLEINDRQKRCAYFLQLNKLVSDNFPSFSPWNNVNNRKKNTRPVLTIWYSEQCECDHVREIESQRHLKKAIKTGTMANDEFAHIRKYFFGDFPLLGMSERETRNGWRWFDLEDLYQRKTSDMCWHWLDNQCR